MKKLLIAALSMVLILMGSAFGQANYESATGAFLKLGCIYGTGDVGDFSGHVVVGLKVKLDNHFETATASGYQKYEFTSNKSLGDIEEFYFTQILIYAPAGVDNNGFVIEVGPEITRSDYTGDGEATDTYISSYFGLGYLYNYKQFKFTPSIGMDITPGLDNKTDLIAGITVGVGFK